MDAAKRCGDVSWEVKHYNVSLIDQIVRVSTDLGFAGADAVFPGWRTLRWGTPKAINDHHFFNLFIIVNHSNYSFFFFY